MLVHVAGQAGAQQEQAPDHELQRLAILHDSPLSPPDVASPRATLDSFLDSVGRAVHLLVSAYREPRREENLFASDSVRERLETARLCLDKAAETFDFSKVPDTHLKAVDGGEPGATR